MNSKQESRMSLLRRAYWQELETGDSSMFLFSPMEKIIEAKTIDEKITALEYLLTSIVRGKQGTTDYYYNRENY
jgi:hypothetical protein